MSKLAVDYPANHCGLMRSGCSLLLHVSEDEHRLFKAFFKAQVESDFFRAFLDGLCVLFYDTVRPLIVNLQHLETLSELTSILRNEMMEYHCNRGNNNLTPPSKGKPAVVPVHLKAFEALVGQLLQDVQERLIFRSHVYIRSDIAEYRPHPGDLSYPEKLEMMESIQESLNKEESKRRFSTSSSVSVSSMEVNEVLLRFPTVQLTTNFCWIFFRLPT